MSAGLTSHASVPHPPTDIQRTVLPLFQFTPFSQCGAQGVTGRQEQQPRPGPQRADNLSVLL